MKKEKTHYKSKKREIENLAKMITNSVDDLEVIKIKKHLEYRKSQDINIAVLDVIEILTEKKKPATFNAIKKLSKVSEENLSNSLAEILDENFGLQVRELGDDLPEGENKEYFLVRI